VRLDGQRQADAVRRVRSQDRTPEPEGQGEMRQHYYYHSGTTSASARRLSPSLFGGRGVVCKLVGGLSYST
jgi:hypothetical protein